MIFTILHRHFLWVYIYTTLSPQKSKHMFASLLWLCYTGKEQMILPKNGGICCEKAQPKSHRYPFLYPPLHRRRSAPQRTRDLQRPEHQIHFHRSPLSGGTGSSGLYHPQRGTEPFHPSGRQPDYPDGSPAGPCYRRPAHSCL